MKLFFPGQKEEIVGLYKCEAKTHGLVQVWV